MTGPMLTLSNIRALTFAAALLALPACTSDTASSGNTPSLSRNSMYDPMRDAAPGDNRPAVPSVSNISPDQSMGNGTDDMIAPSNIVTRR